MVSTLRGGLLCYTNFMDSSKKKIISLVNKYVKEFPEENKLLKEAVVMKRNMYSQGFEKGTDMRPLYELTETLHNIFIRELTEDEMKWLKTKKGGNWFAKEFKVYSFI